MQNQLFSRFLLRWKQWVQATIRPLLENKDVSLRHRRALLLVQNAPINKRFWSQIFWDASSKFFWDVYYKNKFTDDHVKKFRHMRLQAKIYKSRYL